jgi:hypothetical protein
MNRATLKQVRQLLWIYFILLIFEGALRKWFLPGLSSPLLLVREPFAFFALLYGWPLINKKPWQSWLEPLLLIGWLALFFAIAFGHGDLFVAIYGARTFILQLPLIFLYAAVFNKDDVLKFCWALLLLSIPMCILIVLQSNLPETHILNVAPGGTGTALFDGALGRSRPPGTFSFITGVASFFPLGLASLFILLYNTKLNIIARILCTIASIALVVAIPVSISRTLLANYLMVLVSLIVALLIARTRIIPLITGLLGILVAVLIATAIPAFQETSEAFTARWELAGAASGSVREEVGDVGVASDQITKRVLPGLIGPLSHIDTLPFFGHGTGMGSNVGAQRLSGDKVFVLGEGGWEVSLGELGLPLGLAFLFWRIAFGFWLSSLSIKAALRGNILPLILLGTSLFVVVQGQLSQPTALGFVVLSTGLNLASLNPSSPNKVF